MDLQFVRHSASNEKALPAPIGGREAVYFV